MSFSLTIGVSMIYGCRARVVCKTPPAQTLRMCCDLASMALSNGFLENTHAAARVQCPPSAHPVPTTVPTTVPTLLSLWNCTIALNFKEFHGYRNSFKFNAILQFHNENKVGTVVGTVVGTGWALDGHCIRAAAWVISRNPLDRAIVVQGRPAPAILPA